jgi:DUF4097 and DUF4098 domain-containing protein YvlB
MNQEADTIRVKAYVKEKKLFNNRGARVVLQVPPGAVLDLHTSNGKITTAGDTGEIQAESSNGGMEVHGSRSKLQLHTSNGPITVEGGTGRLDLRTSNGKITIQSEKAVVDAHTSNGAVHFKGSLADGDSQFNTSNGSIVLSLPNGAQFRIDGETSNGKIASDFQVKQGQKKRRAILQGTVGDHPATTIKLRTSNGGIEIQRIK